MALTLQEKERTRYHLGYLNVKPAAAITFGVPAPMQTLFLVDAAMDRLLLETEDRVRRILCILDGIENQMVSGQAYLAATQLDDLKPRADQLDALEHEYDRWGRRLANNLGVPIYPYADRYRQGGTVAGSIPVRNS